MTIVDIMNKRIRMLVRNLMSPRARELNPGVRKRHEIIESGRSPIKESLVKFCWISARRVVPYAAGRGNDAAAGHTAGSVIDTISPGSALLARTEPPWSCTARCTMARPRPTPPVEA